MPNLFAWLLAAAWPVVKKVLLQLGIGWLTYEGLSLIANQVVSQAVSIWGQMPADMLMIASRLGIPQSIGIILGAITARVAFVAMGRLGKVTT